MAKVTGQKKKKKNKKAANVVGFWKQTKKSAKKNWGKVTKVTTPVYSKYVKPTVGLATSTGKIATNIGKTLLRFPGPALALGTLASTVKYGPRIQKRPLRRTVTQPQYGKYGGKWMV